VRRISCLIENFLPAMELMISGAGPFFGIVFGMKRTSLKISIVIENARYEFEAIESVARRQFDNPANTTLFNWLFGRIRRFAKC